MAIVIDSVILPDLPEDLITEEFPYAIIAQYCTLDATADEYVVTPFTGKYIVYSVSEPYIYIPSDLTGDIGISITITQGNFGKSYICDTNESDIWELEDKNDYPHLFGGVYDDYVVWSNHDIKIAVEIDMETEIPTAGDEIYFPNSEKPPSETIKLGWLHDIDETKFAPKTIASQVILNDGSGNTVKTKLNSHDNSITEILTTIPSLAPRTYVTASTKGNTTGNTEIGSVTIGETAHKFYAPSISFAQTQTSGNEVGKITINGTATPLYAPNTVGTADKFTSTQKIKLTGDISGEATSQAGWEIETTLADSGVPAGTYDGSLSGNISVGGSDYVPGSSISYPIFTVDSKGRITEAGKDSRKLPNIVTTSKPGFMSVADKLKLDDLKNPLIVTFAYDETNGYSCNTSVSTIATELNSNRLVIGRLDYKYFIGQAVIILSDDLIGVEFFNSRETINGIFVNGADIWELETISNTIYTFADEDNKPTNTKQFWINSSNNVLYAHNGTDWVPIAGTFAN